MTLTRREDIRPRRPLARRVMAVAAAASLFGLGACNESLVPNYNFLTGLSPTAQGVASATAGVYNGRTDAGAWAIWSSGFGREATYFTFSEQRFVTELLGISSPQATDFIGETVWDNEFGLVKTADTAQTAVEALEASGAESPATAEASWAALETGKAMNYLMVAMSRDSVGVPINAVGQTTPPFAPILCNELVWAQIVAMFDSAADSLTAAGPTTAFPGALPPGLSLVSANAGTFESLNFALRAKARVEYAYAIARQNGEAVTGPLSDGAAIAQLDSAVLDVDSSTVIYSPSLSFTEAVPANDPGAFFTYSTLPNDIVNPIFSDIKGYFAVVPYVIGFGTAGEAQAPGTGPNAPVDTLDRRWTAKFVDVGAPPGSANPQLSSTWNYGNNLTGSSPLPIIRNLELQFILARAELGLGNLAMATTIVNNVRTNVGLVSPLAPPMVFDSVASFLITEARLTFIAEGTGEDIMPTRDYGLFNTYMLTATDTVYNTTGDVDTQASLLPIPIEESSPRNGNITPVCTGAVASSPTSKPSGKVTPKAKGGSIIRLH
jgi:hypothetical protein